MVVTDAKRLKALEAGNSRLKRLLAKSMPENEVTREASRINGNRSRQARGSAGYGPARLGRTMSADRGGDECQRIPVSAGAGSERRLVNRNSAAGSRERKGLAWAIQRLTSF